MAQSFEYPMWSPHPKAKLYKRYTADMPVELKDGESVTVEKNRYVIVGRFRWIENTPQDNATEQPLDGLLVSNSYLTIKTNSLKKFACGDIVELPQGSRFYGLWIITEGLTTDIVYTPKAIQTYQYLPLSSVR